MSNYPRLSKAPIVLAILEIKFVRPDNSDVTDFKSLKRVMKDDFPTMNVISNAEIKFSAGGGERTPFSVRNTGVSGVAFVSANRKHEFHLNADSFNFRQHGPYDTWADFKSRALDVWRRAVDVIRPLTLTRMSLRYINRIEIPVDPSNPTPQEQFFKTLVVNTSEFVKEKSISNYAIRLTHPPGDDGIAIHFGQELQLYQQPIFPFIVDIDVQFQKLDIQNDFAFIEKKFDELRDIKNNYFFDNLTIETFNLIK